MSRDSFVFYVKWAKAISGCDAEVKAEVYDAIVEYVISGTIPGLKPLAQMAFNFIKQELDENISKYEAIRIARSNAGKLGGDKMVGNSNAEKQSKIIKNNQNQSNESNEEQNQSKQTVYVNVYDNVNDINNNELPNGSSSSEGVPPTSDEDINFKLLVSYFNQETKGVFGKIVNPLSEKRKVMIRARIRQYGKKKFIEAIQIALKSSFLRGQNQKNWVMDFDWFIRPTNFEKIISGNYSDDRLINHCKNGKMDNNEEAIKKALKDLNDENIRNEDI